MRTLSKLVLMAAVIAAAPAAFAQAGDDAKISVEQPWARATRAGAKTGAAYMTLANKTNAADRLTGASSYIAAKVQIHEMMVDNGLMQMREVTDGLAIRARRSVALKPGSYHVMLIGLKEPLLAGQSFPLSLTFAKAGNISVTVPVQAMRATNASSGMGDMQHADSGGIGKMEMK